ncbi:unnamed protein product, partial [marine sediment metagenome]
NVYSANTIGAIIGSVLAGFALIPLVGMQKSIAAVAMVNIILAVILLNFGLKERKWQRGLIISFLLFFTIPYALAVPEWNKKILASGIYHYAPEYIYHNLPYYMKPSYTDSESIMETWKKITGKEIKEIWKKIIRKEREVLFYKEGTHFTVSVEKRPMNKISLHIDGKTDASNSFKVDMITQLLSAHLPVLLYSCNTETNITTEIADSTNKILTKEPE